MKKLEHWGHRMYPKLPFDDVVARLETLGKKQAVKVYVKRVRMGLVSAPSQGGDDKVDDDEEDTAQR